MNAADKAEARGHESTIELYDRLLSCKTQAQAVPIITGFLEALYNEPKKHRSATCAGISTALVDVLMVGLDAIKTRSAS